MRLTRSHRIGIFGHVGNQNLGDEATVTAVIQGLRDRIPGAEISAFTIHPEDTQARHGIPAFPIRPGVGSPRPASAGLDASRPGAEGASTRGATYAAIRRVPGLYPLLSGARDAFRWLGDALVEAAFWGKRYSSLRRIDLLIVAGSNQLSDYVGGPWGFPYTIFAWSVAARLTGTRVAFLSVGAGPLRTRLGRYFLRKAIGWAVYSSFRDEGSRDTIKSLGVGAPHRVAPDLAHGLRFEVPSDGPRPAATRTVVVNPLPYMDPRFWAESDSDAYARYVDLLASFARTLLERGHRVRLVPTQLRADPPVIADVMRALGPRPRSEALHDRIDPPVAGFEDLIAILAEADVVVATRFHGVVLAQMLGKPTIGIAYRRSTTDLLVDVGQGAYAIDIAALTLDGLLGRLEALEADRGASGRLAARIETYRKAVAAQYDELLGSAGPVRPAPLA